MLYVSMYTSARLMLYKPHITWANQEHGARRGSVIVSLDWWLVKIVSHRCAILSGERDSFFVVRYGEKILSNKMIVGSLQVWIAAPEKGRCVPSVSE